jgi:hypothetical protein
MAVDLKKRERIFRGPDKDRHHGGTERMSSMTPSAVLAARLHERPGRNRHAFLVDRRARGKYREGHTFDRVLALLSILLAVVRPSLCRRLSPG